MSDTTTCAIVGGGPAGMVLGLLLARAGVEVTVLEKHADFLRDFRGDTVHPSTLSLLDDLGLFAAFDALPQSKVASLTVPLPDGGEVVAADFGRLPLRHPYIAMVPQWDLLDLLARAGRQEPTFDLRMRHEATSLVREGDRVTGVRYESPDGPGEVRADLVVACDGRWSFARAAADLPVRDFPVGIDVWWFRVPSRGAPGRSLLPRFAPGRAIIGIPRRGYLQLAYLGLKGEDAALRARGIEAFRREVVAAMPQLADGIDELTSMDDVKHLDVRVNRLRRWYATGLLCLGDAAHAMSPVGGVGINLAVQDAVGAARLLAPRLRTRSVRESDLRRVQWRRTPPTVVIQAVQRAMHARVIEPILLGQATGLPPVVLATIRRVPALSVVPALLVGIGPRPESAPRWARRAPLPADTLAASPTPAAGA